MTTSVNIHEFKTHLSQYARRVKAGETVILCERNVPIAELRPLRKQGETSAERPAPGLFRDQIRIGDAFFEADEAIAHDFYGEDGEDGED